MISLPIEVSAGLVLRDGLILITQRKMGTHLGGFWEFPGGKRNPDESWEGCLIRELEEELGILVTVGDLRFEITHSYSSKSVHLRFYHCTLVRGEPQPIDCEAVLWVRPVDLPLYTFPEADEALVHLLANG